MFGIAFFSIFTSISLAYENIYFQSDASYLQSDNFYSYPPSQADQSIYFTAGASGTIKQVTIAYQMTTSNPTGQVFMAYLGACLSIGNTLYSTSTTSFHTFSFTDYGSGACDVSYGQNTAITLTRTGFSGPQADFSLDLYGSTINPYLKVEGENVIVPISVSLEDPTDNSTTSDFQYWGVRVNNFPTETPITARVYFTENTFPRYQDLQTITLPSGVTSAKIGVLKSLDLSTYATSSWIAYATASFGTSTYTSDVINFSIFADPSVIPPPTSSTTISDTTTNCGGGFSGSICEVFVYLFHPTPDSTGSIGGLFDPIKNKPPLGYFYSLNNVLKGGSSTDNGLRVISSSTASAFDPIFSPIRNMIGGLLWLLVGIFGYKKIANMDI